MSMTTGLQMVFERNAFYRRQYLWALLAFGLCMLGNIVLACVLAYVIRHPTEPLYFAADEVGRLIRVVPVDQPNMSDEEVEAWATRVAQASFSYNYVNYRSQLQAVERFYTNYGWTNYMKALQSSNNLVALTNRRIIQTASVVDKPTVLARGILGGAFAWRFSMPMLVTYWMPPYNDQSKFSNALTVTVIVQRQPILQSDHGLGVLQMIGSMTPPPAGSSSTITTATPTG
jgi:intracellular multiplication protein IcmL